MFRRIGRFLQLLGLVILPIGISGNVARPDVVDLKASLTIAGGGIGVFVLGWLLQQAGKK